MFDRWLALYRSGLAVASLVVASRVSAAESGTIEVEGERPPRSASETVRDRRTIAAAPHRTGADLLLVVPGVFITQHSGQGKAYQIFYRGFDSIHGQDIELKVGGVPVNEVSNIHGQGYADLHFVMPEVVSTITAAPGTYLPSQGDFAVAGSISMGLGYDQAGVTAKGTVGSFGERRYFLAYHPEGTPSTTFGAFEAQSTDGFGPSRAARRTSAIAQHVFEIGHGLSLRVMSSAYAARFDSAGVLLRSDAIEGRFATYDPRQGGTSSRAQLVLDLTHAHRHDDDVGHPGTERWSLVPYLVFRSLKLRQNFTGFLAHPVDGDSQQQVNEAFTMGATALYRRPLQVFSVSDAVELGLSLRNDWIDQSQSDLGTVDDRVLARSVDAKIRATNAAGWLDLAFKPVKRLTLRGGVRIDGLSYSSQDNAPARVGLSGQVRSAMGMHVGPKITADVRAIGALHVVASYGEGFRSPQARSLGEGERTPFTTVRSFELGVRHHEGDAIRFSASGFSTWLSNDLAFDPATARNETVPSTFRRGLALDLVVTPVRWFASSTSATYTRATFTADGAGYAAGDVLPYVPQTVVREDVAFLPVLGHWGKRVVQGRVGAALTGLFGRPLPFNEYADDVFLVDAAASVRVAELELSVEAFNLLGARWWDGTFVYASNWSRGAAPSLVPREHVTAGAPRAVLFTLGVFL